MNNLHCTEGQAIVRLTGLCCNQLSNKFVCQYIIKMSETTIEELPEEVVLEIFKYLNGSMQRTCFPLNALARSEYLHKFMKLTCLTYYNNWRWKRTAEHVHRTITLFTPSRLETVDEKETGDKRNTRVTSTIQYFCNTRNIFRKVTTEGCFCHGYNVQYNDELSMFDNIGRHITELVLHNRFRSVNFILKNWLSAFFPSKA